MTNQEHAGRLLAEAAEASRRRRALVLASTALRETSTITAARNALAELGASGGPVTVVNDALALIDALGAA